MVRIVVVQPAEPAPGRSPGAVEALERLGTEAAIDVVADAEACAARCRAAEVDLVVVDHALGLECDRVLDAYRCGGPPVVVLDAEGDDETALEAFRRGAADCVSAKAGYADVLPVIAAEQIRRWRAIRDRGSAERRIRDLERTNENILQNMNSAVLVVDAEARITSCNPPAEDILGRRAHELRGQSVSDWFKAAGSEIGLVTRTLREEVRFKGTESAITRADGTVVPIGISCAPIFDTDGAKCGAVAIFQDLSEISQLRNQVLQTEKMASIGQLAAGVAHEINNPMGFIHANLFQMAEYLADLRRVWRDLEALQKAIARGSAQDVSRAAEGLAALADEVDVPFLLTDLETAIRESQEGSERIRHIVQDLRDFSHHETGERVLANVNQCLDSTANIVWPMMKHLAVLEKDYGDVPSIYCLPMQLKQVFMNLLVNAFQAIEESVGQSGETGRIRLQSGVRDGGIRISVSDTGVGIAPENLDRIFDPFFTTKKVGSGTGLGLSTSYSIVRRHGGTLTVESGVGQGTTFHVFLPREREADLDGSL
ncbi:MAG: ATP-binding protein [Myxococcales bacterium]|nr:ATP-binding protein [Myxococcales bacterium]